MRNRKQTTTQQIATRGGEPGKGEGAALDTVAGRTSKTLARAEEGRGWVPWPRRGATSRLITLGNGAGDADADGPARSLPERRRVVEAALAGPPLHHPCPHPCPCPCPCPRSRWRCRSPSRRRRGGARLPGGALHGPAAGG